MKFEWQIPLELSGNPIDEIKYRVKFCDFDLTCETQTTLDRMMLFSDRKAGLTYTYTLTTLRADGGEGESHSGEYNSNIGREKIQHQIYPNKILFNFSLRIYIYKVSGIKRNSLIETLSGILLKFN